MLTLQTLKDMKPGQIIASGVMADVPDGLYMAGTGRNLLWVAKRGGIHDWAIYCHFQENGVDYVISNGDKVTDEKHIKMLVPCDDEAFDMYRF